MKRIGTKHSFNTFLLITAIAIYVLIIDALLHAASKNLIINLKQSFNGRQSLKSRVSFVVGTSNILHGLGFEYIAVNVTRDHISSLKTQISWVSHSFKRLLHRARAFRNAFDQLETLHTMIRGDTLGYTWEPTVPDASSYSIVREFIDSLFKLQLTLFPFLPRHYRSGLDLKHSFKGKGIVIAVGNQQVDMAIANIRLLRFLNCNLPIEVFYNGANDLFQENRARLEQLVSVETRNIQQLIEDTTVKLSGWAIKPFAVLLSSFMEVILIDADVVFLQNPSILFSHPEYQRARSLFYYDRTIGGPAPEKIKWLSNIFPKPWNNRLTHSNRILAGLSRENQESGVLVIDKFARFCALLLTCKLNSFRERTLVTYRVFYGDKETFWLGHEMMDENYAFDPHLTGTIGMATYDVRLSKNTSTICGTQIVHFDKYGKILWFNQFVFLNKNIQSQSLARFEHYVKEPGIYIGKPDYVYCLTVIGSASSVHSHDKQRIAQVYHYWTEAINITKQKQRV